MYENVVTFKINCIIYKKFSTKLKTSEQENYFLFRLHLTHILNGQIIRNTWCIMQINHDIALKWLEDQANKKREAGCLLQQAKLFVSEDMGKRRDLKTLGSYTAKQFHSLNMRAAIEVYKEIKKTQTDYYLF